MPLRVITTHLNADFDGLASMIAARKLYPEGLLVFPGSQEKNVREFLNQNPVFGENIVKIKDIPAEQLDTIVLVDIRSSSRLGPLANLLDNPSIKLHIYDHHLDTTDSLTGSKEVIKEVGSTTTIMVNLLRDRAISITADEATLFALGIYEDTGSFTYLSTTADDLICAAWLVQQGARLDEVAQYISHELTTEQLTILHELMKKARQYTIQDIPVVVITHSLPEYVDEFSLIVRRFMAMENLNVVFALLSMSGRTYLIARSRIADVNVGNIARDFGGGGHATAASATIRNLTLIEAEEKLIHCLHRHIHPQPIASEMVSRPAITIPPDASIRDAQAILTRYNITAAPVKTKQGADQGDCGSIVGIISRRIVEKANHHLLGERPVGEYMATEVQCLPLNATLADIQELIIEHRQRLIPIVDKEVLIGVITRTDLLNRLVNDPSHLPKDLLHEADHPSLERTRNLNSLMVELLDRDTVQLLQLVGEVAQKLAFRAFAVGGFVRDLLLKQPNLDLDVVIEGDGIIFAKALAAKLKGRYRTHERFKTAVVLMPNGFKIDIATARLEYYEYPAAMPTVELSSIKLDLSRRDFTINAMAISLNPERFGTLIDFFNCQHDLKQKVIKVLHNLSFVEDPSRIFRAVRFEQRMGFQISTHTKRLIHNAVVMKLFGKTDDSRFFTEMKIICAEKNPIRAIRRLAEFDLFKFLWPNLPPHYRTDRKFLHQLTRVQEVISWFQLLYLEDRCANWMVYLLTIMLKTHPEELENFCKRFAETPKNTQILMEQKELCAKAMHRFARTEAMRPSQIAAWCENITIEGLLHLMAIASNKQTQKAISLYITTLRYVEPELTGNDLVALGYQPGPIFKKILLFLREHRLDNPTQDREDEIQLVRNHFADFRKKP